VRDAELVGIVGVWRGLGGWGACLERLEAALSLGMFASGPRTRPRAGRLEVSCCFLWGRDGQSLAACGRDGDLG